MTRKDTESFNNADKCDICDKKYKETDIYEYTNNFS